MLQLIMAFQIKHLIVDFFLQTKYQYSNKGKFMHPGGLLHSALHGISTIIVLQFFFLLEISILLGILDVVLHYAIDYSKTNITNKYKWCHRENGKLVITSNLYFVSMGIDQFLHQLTYAIIIYIAI